MNEPSQTRDDLDVVSVNENVDENSVADVHDNREKQSSTDAFGNSIIDVAAEGIAENITPEGAAASDEENGTADSVEENVAAAKEIIGAAIERMNADAPSDKVSLFSLSALMTTLSLLMFVGGGLVTMMMIARAFDLHGAVLVSFVVAASSLIVGLAGALMLRMSGDKWWIGMMIGSSFGAMSALLVYSQTKNSGWWQ